ncbi:MAG: fatty acid desaturase [Myxococcales bacterium]|nr:fatty acid desaturase [Myxococcales bacterium]
MAEPTGSEGHAPSERRPHAPWIGAAVRAGKRYHYGRKSAWRHNALNLGCLAGLFALVAGLIVAGTRWHPALYLPIAAFAFGWVYFSFFVLVVHEASHDMFVLMKDRHRQRRVNRAFGWVFAALFATHYVKHWEQGHREHHVRPLEPADPQQHNLLTGRALLTRALCNLFVPGYLFLERTIFRTRRAGGKSSSTKGVLLTFVAIWATILTITALAFGWAVPTALFLGVHVVTVLNHVKGSLEHGGPIGREADPFLRSRTTLFPLRWLVMPFNITLHFEHHLNFQVPWYDLVRFHRDLEAIVPRDVWVDVINHAPMAQLAGNLGGVRAAHEAAALPAAAE